MKKHFFCYYTQESKKVPETHKRKYRVYPNKPQEPKTILESLSIAQLCASKNNSLTAVFVDTDEPVISRALPKPKEEPKTSTDKVMNEVDQVIDKISRKA